MSNDMESRMHDQIEGAIAAQEWRDLIDIFNMPTVNDAFEEFSHNATEDNACHVISMILSATTKLEQLI